MSTRTELHSSDPPVAGARMPTSPGVLPWWRKIAFWRAVAGMAVAAALAAVIVLAEFTDAMRHRMTHYLHREATLKETVEQLRRRVSSTERQRATSAERVSGDEILKRVVSAPDLRIIKMTDAQAASANTTASATPSATLGVSDSQKAAVLQVAGLAPSNGGVYRVWWQQKRGPGSLAAEFIPGKDGRATVPMQIPPVSAIGVEITSEAGTDTARPSGQTILRGRISVRDFK